MLWAGWATGGGGEFDGLGPVDLDEEGDEFDLEGSGEDELVGHDEGADNNDSVPALGDATAGSPDQSLSPGASGRDAAAPFSVLMTPVREEVPAPTSDCGRSGVGEGAGYGVVAKIGAGAVMPGDVVQFSVDGRVVAEGVALSSASASGCGAEPRIASPDSVPADRDGQLHLGADWVDRISSVKERVAGAVSRGRLSRGKQRKLEEIMASFERAVAAVLASPDEDD